MAEGETGAGRTLLGHALVASGAMVGVLSGLCTGGGMLLSYAVTAGGVLRRPGAPTPPPDWAAAAVVTLAPLHFGAWPLALAGALIYGGRRMLRAKRNALLGGLGLAVGAMSVAASLSSLALRSGMDLRALALPALAPGIVLLGLGAFELRRTGAANAER